MYAVRQLTTNSTPLLPKHSSDTSNCHDQPEGFTGIAQMDAKDSTMDVTCRDSLISLSSSLPFSPNTPTGPQPTLRLEFRGHDATECEDFINAVQRYTLSQGKQADDRWMAQFAASCFTRDALRWWTGLEEDVQWSWKLLRKAMLGRYRPLFQGISGEEAEYFVHMVTERALDEGKYDDARWTAAFASACLVGDALRWWASLPQNVRKDWDLLQQAILLRFPTIPRRLVPTPAAAAPPPVPAWRSVVRGRILIAIDGDSTCYYISKQLGPGAFTVITSYSSLALEVEFNATRLERAILFIPPGQTTNFDTIGMHWAGNDPTSEVK
ncbi:hypothetical protein FS837_001383 [Tulasnella sp. UAMH 9824]|nr:hypothetical protein FS837_001383 [Tulasnella sp. UAMH 9824]